jgi:uncharacterized protein
MSSTVARRLFFALLCVVAAPLFALDVPLKPSQWVNDYGANLLSASETQQLDQKIEQMRARTGAQMLVMIWPSLEGEDAHGFTRRVAKMWKVDDDRALMLFVFVEDRKTFLQVGRGLKTVITDAYAADIYRNTLVPHFRQRQYYAGMDMAIDRLTAMLEPPPAPGPVAAPPPARAAVQTPQRETSDLASDDLVIVIAIVAIGFVVFVLVILWRKGGLSSGGAAGAVNTWAMLQTPPPADTTSSTAATSFVGSADTGGSSVGGSWDSGASSFDGNGAGGSW